MQRQVLTCVHPCRPPAVAAFPNRSDPTAAQGSLLARHYAQAGLKVWVGSRDAAKARSLAQELRGMGDGRGLQVEGGTNAEAAERADVVFWCIQVMGGEGGGGRVQTWGG